MKKDPSAEIANIRWQKASMSKEEFKQFTQDFVSVYSFCKLNSLDYNKVMLALSRREIRGWETAAPIVVFKGKQPDGRLVTAVNNNDAKAILYYYQPVLDKLREEIHENVPDRLNPADGVTVSNGASKEPPSAVHPMGTSYFFAGGKSNRPEPPAVTPPVVTFPDVAVAKQEQPKSEVLQEIEGMTNGLLDCFNIMYLTMKLQHIKNRRAGVKKLYTAEDYLAETGLTLEEIEANGKRAAALLQERAYKIRLPFFVEIG
jgi:hypothetical protein